MNRKRCARFASLLFFQLHQFRLDRSRDLTCKCPWYILSAQSGADPSSGGGSSHFFQTWSRQQSVRLEHKKQQQQSFGGRRSGGADRAELSSPQVLKTRSSRICEAHRERRVLTHCLLVCSLHKYRLVTQGFKTMLLSLQPKAFQFSSPTPPPLLSRLSVSILLSVLSLLIVRSSSLFACPPL